MAKPTHKPALHTVSDSDLATALRQIGAEIDHQPLRSSALARIMRECFGGSDAAGAWDWRMAYDMMQAAAVMQVVKGTGHDTFAIARLLASRLLTETRRSEQQIRCHLALKCENAAVRKIFGTLR